MDLMCQSDSMPVIGYFPSINDAGAEWLTAIGCSEVPIPYLAQQLLKRYK